MNKKIFILDNKYNNNLKIIISLIITFLLTNQVTAQEGSGNWKQGETGKQSSIYVPGNNNVNTGWDTRGSMMRPTAATNYDANHRFYVYVKQGETVYFAFRSTTSTTFVWRYDNTTSGAKNLFPTTVNTSQINNIKIEGINTINSNNSNSLTEAQALIGPAALKTGGYTGGYFTNTTGADRAFWMEVTTPGSAGFEITDWDVTVASNATGTLIQQKGRVYCKYWSIYNGLPNSNDLGNSNATSFHSNFGFYVAADNTNTVENDFFIKKFGFKDSNAGYVVFFANDSGPSNIKNADNTPNIVENRKSITGTSNRYQYPLFVAEPDPTIWPDAPEPKASTKINFYRNADGNGGYADFHITVDTPGILDILVDIDGNGTYSEGDVILFKNIDTPGKHTVTWDGKNNIGQFVPNGTIIKLVTSIIFFPVHFPIFDMEQSLGMTVENIRPGKQITQKLYWDHSNIYEGEPGTRITTNVPLQKRQWGTIPRNKTISRVHNNNVQSISINRTGIESPANKWFGNSTGGAVGNDNTINVYAGSQQEILEESFPFNWDSSDIKVEKTVNNTTPNISTDVTFTIKVTNLGLMDAANVIIEDLLPSGYQYLNSSVTQGSYIPTSGIWTIGAFANQAVATLTVIAKVKSTGNYTNTAFVSPKSTLTDNDLTNNSSTVTVIPIPYCTQPGNFTENGAPTIVGINTQTSTLNGWPEHIPNGFITMETTNKGFSITRVPNASTIVAPLNGMIVYDISAKCIKLYRNNTWNCITRTCNN